MKNEQRREKILAVLNENNEAVNATVLAKMFSVTRQIIVADIALLRAAGYNIRSEHKGYVMTKKDGDRLIKRIVVKHSNDVLKDELYAVVDNGGVVIDVIVEHAVYGKLSAELNLSSRYEIDCFVQKITVSGVSPLSLLTEGLHIHTISVKDEQTFERIVRELEELKILIEYA